MPTMFDSRITGHSFSPEMPPKWMMPSTSATMRSTAATSESSARSTSSPARAGASADTIGEAQHRIDAPQSLAQRAADAPAGTR